MAAINTQPLHFRPKLTCNVTQRCSLTAFPVTRLSPSLHWPRLLKPSLNIGRSTLLVSQRCILTDAFFCGRYQKELQKYPGHPQLLYELAMCYYSLRHYPECSYVSHAALLHEKSMVCVFSLQRH
jgi:hypothetical protein